MSQKIAINKKMMYNEKRNIIEKNIYLFVDICNNNNNYYNNKYFKQ